MKTEIELAEIKQDLKLKYGKVLTVIVPLDEDDSTKTATLFLKKPDKAIRNMVGSLQQKSGGEKVLEAGLKALYIGGDELSIVLNNDDAFAACDATLVEIFEVQKAVLKKN
jgi:hypothetical protein